MGKRARQGGLVYSTDGGRSCPGCRRPVADCACRDRSRARGAEGDGIVRLQRQTRGRKGAGVTLVTGVPLAAGELAALAKRLKAGCGVGGTLKDGVIELQGDQRAKLKALLEADGFTVRIAGG